MNDMIRCGKGFLIITLLFLSKNIYAQTPDEIVSKLMNEQKMFELRDQHEELQEQLAPVLNYFAQSMLAESFNDPESGIIAIDTLLNNEIYQQQLGINNVAYLIYLKSGFLEILFKYKESAEILESFIAQTKDVPINETLRSNLEESLKVNKIIGLSPATRVIRPSKNVKINYEIKRAGKGQSLNLPCQINGIETLMCLDTGNPKYTLVSDDLAKKCKIKTIVDSIPMEGVGTGFAKIGIADSISLGEITLYNSLFYIVNKITPVDTIPLDAVLGSEVLNLIGEIQFSTATNTIVFPYSNTTPTLQDRNLIMHQRHLFIQLGHNSKKMLMHFDTGASLSNMNNLFFEENKDFIEKTALSDTIRIAGYGGIHSQVGYKLPKLAFILDKKKIEMEDISVYTENLMNQWDERGCFGVDFIQKFKKVILSYKNMFIAIEQ